MNFDWRDDDLRRAQREEEALRSQMSDLDEALQRALPKAPPHPHLLHSREEWEGLTRRPGFAPEMQRGSAEDYFQPVGSSDWMTAEELTRKPSPATNALLRMLREAQAPTKPAPYTIDFPNAHLRMRTATDPDALLRIVQDVEIIDGPTAKPVEWGSGYCYAQGEGR